MGRSTCCGPSSSTACATTTPTSGSLIKGDDVERLSQILSGNTEPPTKPPS